MVLRKVNIYRNPGVSKMLTDLGPDGRKVLADTLNESAQLMFRKSQQIVPHETGVLQGSGRLTPARAGDAKPEVTIGYGGAASKYALIQHEKKLRHPNPRAKGKSRANGQWKYLETPVREGVPELKKRLLLNIAKMTK